MGWDVGQAWVADAGWDTDAGWDAVEEAWAVVLDEATPDGQYVARTVTFGDRTVVLRDRSLRPVWAGQGPSSKPPLKIAVTAAGPKLDADVDPQFGRCPYFVVIDPKTGSFEARDKHRRRRSDRLGESSYGNALVECSQWVADERDCPVRQHHAAAQRVAAAARVDTAGGVRRRGVAGRCVFPHDPSCGGS